MKDGKPSVTNNWSGDNYGQILHTQEEKQLL